MKYIIPPCHTIEDEIPCMCERHHYKTIHAMDILLYDVKHHTILFFYFCTKCADELGDSRVEGHKIELPIEEWLKYYNYDDHLDN